MAAPPESTNVSPAMPMNSASSRRSRWSGLVQSAKPRWPPTEAIRAALPIGSRLRGEVVSSSMVTSASFATRWDVGRAAAGEREGVDDLVVQVFGYAVGQGSLLEGQVVVDGVVGDLGGLVVPDHRGQRGDHHHRPVDVVLELGLVQRG